MNTVKTAVSWAQTAGVSAYDAKTQTEAKQARSFSSQTDRKRMEDVQVLFRVEGCDAAMQTPRPTMQETAISTTSPVVKTIGFQTTPSRREDNTYVQTEPLVLEVVSRVQVGGDRGQKAKVVTWDILPQF